MTLRWKMQREFERVKKQVQSLRWYIWGPVNRWRYDRRRLRDVRVSAGAIPAGDEAAVLLIYQPDGVSDATLFTLSWLGRQGLAPVVVSNLPLSGADRARLCGSSHLVIERPNTGYDFGGYREGVLTVLDRGIGSRGIYVMNDSMWFPLTGDSDAIARARDCDADLYGLLCNVVTQGKQRSYLQSYFFRFGPRLIASPVFRDYWRLMPLMDNKHLVVRRCERRLTRHFVERGFSLGYRHHSNDLIEALLVLDDAALAEAVRFMMEAGPKDRARLAPLMETSRPFAETRPEIEQMIRTRRVQSTFFAHPGLMLDMGVPFLKKGQTQPARAQRRWLVDSDVMSGFAAPIRDEITAAVQKDQAGL